MDFFKAFPNEKRLPGLERLYGGRWAMTRMVAIGDGSEVVAADLPANTTAFSYEATAGELAQITAAGITPGDFRLTGVTLGGQGEEIAAIYKYETLSSVLVAMGEAGLGRDANDILVARIAYIGLPGATGGLATGAVITVSGTACIVAESEVVQNDAFTRVTYVARAIGGGVDGKTEIQIGGDDVRVDPNGRHVLIRRTSQASSATFVSVAIGTALTVASVVYALAEEAKQEDKASRTIVRNYVEATATLTQVGGEEITLDENGRRSVKVVFIQKSTGTYTPGTIGVTAAPTTANCVLASETAQANGAVRSVARTYIEATATLTQVGGEQITLDENALRTVKATFIQLTTATYTAGTIGTTAAPTIAACVLASETAQANGAVRSVARTYIEATATLTQVGGEEITNDENGRKRIGAVFIQKSSAAYIPGVVGTTPAPVTVTAFLASERVSVNGAIRTVTRSYIEGIHNIYRDMAIQFPGVRPSAWTLLDDFPFRSEPTSRVVTVRVARKFFVTNDPRRIPLLDAFRPISSRTGDEVTVLDDDSSVTSDEYLGWVASGTEFVDRCLRLQVAGNVWARDTYYVKAE